RRSGAFESHRLGELAPNEREADAGIEDEARLTAVDRGRDRDQVLEILEPDLGHRARLPATRDRPTRLGPAVSDGRWDRRRRRSRTRSGRTGEAGRTPPPAPPSAPRTPTPAPL